MPKSCRDVSLALKNLKPSFAKLLRRSRRVGYDAPEVCTAFTPMLPDEAFDGNRICLLNLQQSLSTCNAGLDLVRKYELLSFRTGGRLLAMVLRSLRWLQHGHMAEQKLYLHTETDSNRYSSDKVYLFTPAEIERFFRQGVNWIYSFQKLKQFISI